MNFVYDGEAGQLEKKSLQTEMERWKSKADQREKVGRKTVRHIQYSKNSGAVAVY